MPSDFLFPEPATVTRPSIERFVMSKTDFGFLRPLKPTIVFETYWRFAAERQSIFFRRIENAKGPWTTDPILQVYKFTNAYRASDRVSQYLIKNVIYDGTKREPADTLFRILVFKIFNRIDTWSLLQSQLGNISWRTFDFSSYDRVLSDAMIEGKRIYSPAYIMPSGGRSSHHRKHQMHLTLIKRMIEDNLVAALAQAQSMRDVFLLLRGYPTIGDFLAYQYTIDINYSELTGFDEMSFVVPGPGALSGIQKCFEDLGGRSEAEVIKMVTSYQRECFAALGIQFPSLWGRPLQLIDCQNLFCEVDKYSRVMHPEFSGSTSRVRIKQKFSPSDEPLSYWYPPKWSLNSNSSRVAIHA